MTFPSTQALTELFLPSLQAMGVWAYWAIGAAALFEAFFLTGVVLPGSFLVDLSGVLVHRGILDFIDLLWFVALGSWIGSYGSFRFGQRVAIDNGGKPRFDPTGSPTFAKALSLFRRHGAIAILLGRFSGPVAGLVPFAAGFSGMPRRRFLVLSAIGAVPYAIVHVALGYGASELLARLSPALAREAVALVAVLLALALLWIVLMRIIRLLPSVLVILTAALRGMLTEPSVAGWLSARPRLVSFVSARLSPSHFHGLPLTLTLAALAGLGGLWLGSTIDYLSGDPIIRADRNIASLLHSLQTPFGLEIAARVTAIGGWLVALCIFVAFALAFWFLGQRALALGLGVATLGETATVSVLKPLFGRIRPSVAHFTETSASFPSGHAALSVALFGFLAYAACRARLLGPRSAVPVAGLLILSIGFSRLYLGEHYLSDVVNGFLVGAIWLVVGIAASEAFVMAGLWHGPSRKTLALGTSLPLLTAALLIAAVSDKPVAPVMPPAVPVLLNSASELPVRSDFDPFAESLIGLRVEPVSLILIAPDAAAIRTAFTRAGWDAPAPADLRELVDAALAAWTNRSDPVAPITPYFRDGQPNDLAFQKPDATDSLRRRHHLRLWQTPFRLRSGEMLFLATASFDDGLKWGLVHHISPDLDAERDAILKGLEQAGVLAIQSVLDGKGPLSGRDEFGDPWFSNGRIVIANVTLAR